MKKLGAFRLAKTHAPPANEDAARAFVRGEAAGSRRRKEPGERVGVYLPPEVARAVRVACAHSGRSVSDAITEAVCAWLKGQPK